MKRISIGVAMVIVGLAAPALSAHALGPLELGFGGGISMPVSGFKDSFDNGFNLMGIVNFKPPFVPLGLRGTVGYQRFGAVESGAVTGGSTKMTSVLGGLTYSVIPVGPVTPYLTLSAGVFHVNTDITFSGDKTRQKKTAFGMDAGLGVKFNLVAIKGFVEGRFENVFAKDGLHPALGHASDLRATPITVGILF